MTRTYRKPYTGSKRFDTTCRNHGRCGWCESRRTHKNQVRARIAWEKMKDWFRLDKRDENADNSE